MNSDSGVGQGASGRGGNLTVDWTSSRAVEKKAGRRVNVKGKDLTPALPGPLELFPHMDYQTLLSFFICLTIIHIELLTIGVS